MRTEKEFSSDEVASFLLRFLTEEHERDCKWGKKINLVEEDYKRFKNEMLYLKMFAIALACFKIDQNNMEGRKFFPVLDSFHKQVYSSFVEGGSKFKNFQNFEEILKSLYEEYSQKLKPSKKENMSPAYYLGKAVWLRIKSDINIVNVLKVSRDFSILSTTVRKFLKNFNVEK